MSTFSALSVLLLAWVALIQIVGADCLANFDPKDVYSTSVVASVYNSGDAVVVSALQNYTVTFPILFSTSPQIAISMMCW